MEKNNSNKNEEQSEIFKILADQSPNMIFINNMGRIVFVNKRCVDVMGYSEKEFYSKDFDFMRLIAPEDKKIIEKNFMQHALGKEVPGCEYKVLTKDDKNIDSVITTKLIKYKGEKAILGIVTDISDLKKTFESLQESEEKFRNIVENSEAVIFIIGKDGKFTLSEGKGLAALGLRPGEAVGKSALEMYKEYPSVIRGIKEALKGNVYKDIISIHGSTRELCYSTFFSPYHNPKGDIVGTLGMSIDITEQKIIEEALKESRLQYQTTVESITDSIHLIDKDKKIVLFNKSFRTWTKELDLKTTDDVIGKTIFEVFPFLDKKLSEEYDKVFNSKKTITTEDITEVNNRKIITETKKIPIIDNGIVKHVLTVIRDITEQKKFEKALEDSKALIEEEVEKKTILLKKTEEQLKEANLKLEAYALRLHHKIKRIDDKRIPLTSKEKIAFYGLVRYADLTTKEVAKKLDMHPATVNAIKNRLKKEGYYRSMYIPRFDMIGCKLLSISYYTKITEKKNTEGLTLATMKDILKGRSSHPEKVFILPGKTEGVAINISKDWHVYKEMQDKVEDIFNKKGIEFENYEQVHFLSDKSRFIRYFDFAKMLDKRFELGMDDEEIEEAEYKSRKLSLTEKRLLYGLVQYPEATVAKLSKHINISVPTICKIRKRFIDEKIIKPINYPDFRKIGMELAVLKHHKISNQRLTKDELIPGEMDFFSIISDSDHISISLYRDFTEAQEYLSRCHICNSNKLAERPSREIIPLDRADYSTLELASLVKKMFDLR